MLLAEKIYISGSQYEKQIALPKIAVPVRERKKGKQVKRPLKATTQTEHNTESAGSYSMCICGFATFPPNKQKSNEPNIISQHVCPDMPNKRKNIFLALICIIDNILLARNSYVTFRTL